MKSVPNDLIGSVFSYMTPKEQASLRSTCSDAINSFDGAVRNELLLGQTLVTNSYREDDDLQSMLRDHTVGWYPINHRGALSFPTIKRHIQYEYMDENYSASETQHRKTNQIRHCCMYTLRLSPIINKIFKKSLPSTGLMHYRVVIVMGSWGQYDPYNEDDYIRSVQKFTGIRHLTSHIKYANEVRFSRRVERLYLQLEYLSLTVFDNAITNADEMTAVCETILSMKKLRKLVFICQDKRFCRELHAMFSRLHELENLKSLSVMLDSDNNDLLTERNRSYMQSLSISESLTELRLDFGLSDDDFHYLATFTNLRKLDLLSNTFMCALPQIRFPSSVTSLSMELYAVRGVGDSWLRTILPPGLTELEIQFGPDPAPEAITEESLRYIATLPLQRLFISGHFEKDYDFAELFGHLPSVDVQYNIKSCPIPRQFTKT